MYQTLALFRMSSDMARHAGQAQAQIARNVAHADTPGYRAQALPDFADTLRPGPQTALRRTRPGHVMHDTSHARARLVDRGSEPAPNGNSVSLEDELLASVDAGSSHRRALAIYSHTMTVLRTTLGR
ncbi:flagellar biosynthesis protein FlgB [Loktanella sp. 3ANDIMAR09]|uniref:FlgB family protein n=1 Tax=Loktanella sp. 3ANDIMAR09 TaxID=1225657 RepID=UPI0006F375DD|nr:FlgB family protein [Loktanella sp. 3ANDIMAR09]KQI69935.1 flagellar biosynthesis protein FlgB [Loktanella sp. 3ANDIMAR09]